MSNMKKILSAVRESECDALMITGETNRRYATGFPSSAGIVLVTGSEAFFFTDCRYLEAARRAIGDANVMEVSGDKSYSARINEITGDLRIKTIGFEQETVTYADYQKYSSQLDAELVPTQQILTQLRSSKSREELQHMIEAQRIAEKSFLELLRQISTDKTEREVAAELVCLFLKNGADDKSFDPIVVSGERSSMPHGVPTDQRIQRGFLTIDFGVKYDGWCSDTTRTVCIGEPTEEMRIVYDTVHSAQKAGIKAARAGVSGKEIDGAARRMIEEAGYGEFFGHGFGHGLGLEVHEAPTAARTRDEIMPDGAVLSAEPGIYLPGRFGVRIEDVLYLTDTGSENITSLPKDLIIL